MRAMKRIVSVVLTVLILMLSVLEQPSVVLVASDLASVSNHILQTTLEKLTKEGTFTYQENGAFVCENSTGIYIVNEEGTLTEAERNYSSSSAIIPYGVKKIHEDAIAGEMIETLYLPPTMSSTGKYAFSGCTKLKYIFFSEGLKEISVGAFYNCKSLESFVCPESIEFIGKSALEGCASLTSIRLNEGVKQIRENAFADCDLIESMYFPESVYRIDATVLANCDKIKKVLVYELSEYDEYAFAGMGYAGRREKVYVYGIAGSFVEENAKRFNYVFVEMTPEIIQEMRGTQVPTSTPAVTKKPTKEPVVTKEPTKEPVVTKEPTKEPVVTKEPTKEPAVTKKPTKEPVVTKEPTKEPVVTKEPTKEPAVTKEPTKEPAVTKEPTKEPAVTKEPTKEPVVTKEPTKEPVVTKEPTKEPLVTKEPTKEPVVTKQPVSTPVITEKPKSEMVTVYYSSKNWSKVNIHYKVGNGSWTQVPGKKMSSSNLVEGYNWTYTIETKGADNVTVCFNDGQGKWDSNYGRNYVIGADGFYGVLNGRIYQLKVQETPRPAQTKVPVVTGTPVPTRKPAGNTVTVYYEHGQWSNVNIHYKTKSGAWTKVPGVPMKKTSVQPGYRWEYTIDMGSDTQIQVCFNNGIGQWDSRNASNYWLGTGVFGIKDGKIYELKNNSVTTSLPDVTLTPTNVPVVTTVPTLKPTNTPFVTSAPTVKPVNTPVVTTKPVITPLVTQTPNGNVVTVYYGNKQWKQAYIHYKVNGKWTSLPGVKMSSSNQIDGYQWKYDIPLSGSKSAMVCFTDGAGRWDSRDGKNYMVCKGICAIRNEVCNVLSGGNYVTVYYENTQWNNAYVHYKKGNGNWTSIPGIKMKEALDGKGYRWLYTIALEQEENVTLCFTNGNGQWDSRNGQNYTIEHCSTVGITNQKIVNMP